MKTFVKRFVLVAALLLSLAAVFLGGAYVLLRGTPDFYRRAHLTPEARAAAATRAEVKFSEMQNLAAEAHGAEVSKLSGASRPITPPGARTFSFTDDELNALFNKWAELYDWKDIMDRLVEDPQVILQDGRIIFAGKMRIKDVDTVVSVHFEPKLTADGQLDLKLVSILGGKLPLPTDTVVNPMRDRFVGHIINTLPNWQQRAQIAPNGAANDDAVRAALAKLTLHSLSHETALPVMFLPLVAHSGSTVPVKILNLSISNNTLSLTVVPMNSADRAALLDQIRQPVHVGAGAQSN